MGNLPLLGKEEGVTFKIENMTEITIKVRENGTLSIQAAGIKDRIEEAEKLLRRALLAMGKEPDEAYLNEIIFYAR